MARCWAAVLGLLPELQDPGQTLDRPVARAREWVEPVALADQPQDRGGLELGMVDMPLARERGDHDRRDARPGPEEVGAGAGGRPVRRRHMIPEAAVLVIGDDDDR